MEYLRTIVEVFYWVLIAYRCASAVFCSILWFAYASMHRRRSAAPILKTEMQVAIVCPTIRKSPDFKTSILSWLANQPHQIIIVTGPPNHEYIEHLLHPLRSPHLQIVRAPMSNKRAQLCIGFLRAQAPVILTADDDTVWSPTVLSALAAPFARLPNLGAVFPEIQLASSGPSRTVWEELAVLRLFGDAVDSRASQVLDGGVWCASGPAAAVRAEILQDERFQSYFRTETWRGAGLNAGDDQALTRWLCGERWDVMVLPDDDWGGCRAGVRVDKRSRPTWRHVLQLLRWSRSDWQANIRALLVERVIWRRHPFTALTRLAWSLGSFTFLIELAYLWTLPWTFARGLLAVALVATILSRLIRYLQYGILHPRKVLYFAPFLLYLYLQQIVKIYALLTLGNVSLWLERKFAS